MPGNPDIPNPAVRRVRRRYVWLTATALAALTLVDSCSSGTTEPVGVCVRSDGVIVKRGITQDACKQLCPDCTWTTADS